MHSIQTLPPHQDHRSDQMQVQIQQLNQHQMQHQQQTQANDTTLVPNMTILEPSIEQRQQSSSSLHLDDQHQQRHHLVMTLLDPVAQPQPIEQQQQSISNSTVQHLVQPPPAPHLHQLQPSQSATNLTELVSGSQVVGASNDQPQQANDEQQQAANRSSDGGILLRQRTQIEGIVADGGGPIVQWLLENYEIADGESLPRSTVYNHYLSHCRQLQMASVNAASFGKLIRSVFVGLKTRRLGTRGHSKYHYFGVRAKQHIQQQLQLIQQQESASCSRDMSNNENSNHNTENGSESESTDTGAVECTRLSGKRIKRSRANFRPEYNHNIPTHNADQHPIEDNPHQQQQLHSSQQSMNGGYYNGTNGYGDGNGITIHNKNNVNSISAESAKFDKGGVDYLINYLGANWSTLVDENWPQPDTNLIELLRAKNISLFNEPIVSSLQYFETKYRSYYKRMVELLSELRFMEIENLWQEFWHPNEDQEVQTNKIQWSSNASQLEHHHHNGLQQQTSDLEQQQHHQHLNYTDQQARQLSFHYLFELTSEPLIIERINQIDYNLYAALESFLFPEVLSSIPSSLSKSIDLFAKNIGTWTETSVKDYEPQFSAEKSKSALAFGYALGRYTSLNRLASASRAVWAKRSLLTQMSIDLSRLDLRDIEHQVSLIGNGTNDNHIGLMNQSTQLTQSNRQNIIVNDVSGSQAADNNENNHLADHHQNHQQQHPQHLCTMQPAQLIQNFLHLLSDPNPADRWPDWCKILVESRVCGYSHVEAKNFVFKWSYYMYRITKKLALKSAPSLSSFQLIMFLFEEYMFYLALTRLAQAQNKTVAQLIRPTSSSAPGYENL